ncbi:MAG: HNH endonuclease [Hyphomonadaceae bacterium]|nr:HNH endonuclease [Hyphomonadaceae bacterium]
MGVKLVVAVTDGDWFDTLRAIPNLAEANFWSPSPTDFKALQPGELFLFKLHSPRNFIVGGGVFAYANVLPVSLAWQAFGHANGASSLIQMRGRIEKYRRGKAEDYPKDFAVGCRILTQPFFLEESDWIPAPTTWAPNIVSFKTFDSDNADGKALWDAVQSRALRQIEETADAPRFGTPHLVKPRLGQGAFRVVVTDSYRRRCAITGEKTLPALEAAHILPYGEGGSHDASNGILFRRDIHSLFDAGYVTVTPDLKFEVSRRIKEEFENGRHYYALHGQGLATPERREWRPDPLKLSWHNERRFLG